MIRFLFSLVTIFFLLTPSQPTLADWRDGKGVVFFESDEEKVIYRDNTILLVDEIDEHHGTSWIDRFQKSVYFSEDKEKYLDKNFSPNGAVPNWDYSIIDDNLTVDNLTEFWPSYFMQISRSSEPITTRPGFVPGDIRLEIGRSQCLTNRVTYSGPTLGELDPATRFYKYIPRAFSAFEFRGKDNYSNGWSACSRETETHQCMGDGSLGFTTEVYAQREAKTAYTWAKVWPSLGKIERHNFAGEDAYDRYAARERLKTLCKSVGAKISYQWWSGAPTQCKGTWNSVGWDTFKRFPTKRSSTSKHCRLIKAFR